MQQLTDLREKIAVLCFGDEADWYGFLTQIERNDYLEKADAILAIPEIAEALAIANDPDVTFKAVEDY